MCEECPHNGEVPADHFVVRLAKGESSDGQVSQLSFEISTDDRKEAEKTGDPPYMSVWSEDHTTLAQALAFMSYPDQYRWACRLEVRAISSIPTPDGIPPLRVLWKTLPIAARLGADDGAEGHAGIQGVSRPDKAPKKSFKQIRRTLYEMATKNAIPIPESARPPRPQESN